MKIGHDHRRTPRHNCRTEPANPHPAHPAYAAERGREEISRWRCLAETEGAEGGEKVRQIISCWVCGKPFTSYNPNPKFCSLKCKGDYQAPRIDIERLNKMYSEGFTQTEIANEFGVSQKSIFKAMRRNGIKSRVAYKRNQLGECNHQWKGNDASKYALHRRLYSRFGKPCKCSVCGTTTAKHYDYANLTGNYEDLNDYAPMCRSCHWKYDNKINNIHHMRKETI